MPNFKKPNVAPKFQTMPSTPTDRREAGTSRPAPDRKLDAPPATIPPKPMRRGMPKR